MDSTTLFLAKVFGLYLIVFGIFMVVRKKNFLERINEFMENPSARFFSVFVTLILGILLVVSHNEWTMSWGVIITILSWWVFIKGVLRLFYPEIDQKWAHMFDKDSVYYPTVVITLALGIFLMYMGLVT